MEVPEERNQLLAGASEVEITPPLEVGLLMSSAKQLWEPFESKRLPLMARVLLLSSQGNFVALCALDLLGLASVAVGGWESFKQRISEATDKLLSAHEIVITSTHTHTAPESLALSNLYQLDIFQQWIDQVVAGIGQAILQAREKLTLATASHGSALVSGLSLSRRIKTAEGIKLTHELSPEEIPDDYRKNVDERVQVISFRQPNDVLIGIVVHAVCHPVIEMCIRHISPDFPGELSLALEKRFKVPVLFMNGACANINPVDICGGPEKAKQHAAALMHGAIESLAKSKALVNVSVSLRWDSIQLPARDETGRQVSSPVKADLGILCLSNLKLVFLPGEIFLETGLAIENFLKPLHTIIVGFAEAYIGYVCPKEVYEEGGYEAGPGRWSTLQPGAEEILRVKAIELAAN